MPIISIISFPLDIDDLGVPFSYSRTRLSWGRWRHYAQPRDYSGRGQIYYGRHTRRSERCRPLEPGVPVDAFLNPVSPIDLPTVPPLLPAIRVQGFPVFAPGGSPLKYDNVTIVPASDGTGVGTNIPAGLYQLVTTIRYSEFAGPGSEVRVAGRGRGPLIEFFQPT
jgi:hypothetical protein